LNLPRTRTLAAIAAAATLVPAAALADPAGRTTLDETIQIGPGDGFRPLVAGPGETYVVRRLGRARADARREARRRSLLFFAQITDPQIADEMSPARIDFIDPAGRPAQDGLRPQETMDLQTFDQVLRNLNLNRTSPVEPGRGARAGLRFAVATGDMADNVQLNETRWVVDTLEGNVVDPFSGVPATPENCPSASSEELARMNADVAARRYTGLQDYDDYRGVSEERMRGYWDPDEAPPGGGPYAGFPRYPGLLDRAQRQFDAGGLDVPWYTSRGNHDGLVTGNASPSFAIARALITGCNKIFPSDGFDPAQFSGRPDSEILSAFADPAVQSQALAGARRVPPDPDRRFVSAAEYKQLHGTADDGHGYEFVNPTELRRSNGHAPYYAWTPKRGFRFISIDTVAEAGGQDGNLDHPQYKWLKRELDKNSRTEVRGRRVVRDGGRNNLIVIYGHHQFEDLTVTANDESVGRCSAPNEAGCDTDPRRSTPIHRGLAGRNNVRDLMLKYPNVVAYVTGHSHENTITPFQRRDRRGGFWEVNTASHVDFPQQSRLIEIMANGNGTLSLFGTILDSAAPIEAPPPGDAGAFTEEQLASLSRQISANDPQGKSGLNPGYDAGLGDRTDRNVELILPDPRRRR
jgi:metallophosphoesterase (TIGR03767 family)